jgi:hypothetical protein
VSPPNFTGSTTPSDWIFDLDLPPDAHPIDVQAYLYLIGTNSPNAKGYLWESAIQVGAERLRAAKASGGG